MTENKLYVEGTYPNNYNKYIENIDEPFKKWKISDVKKQCLIAYGFNNIDEAKQKWGKETNNIIKALIPSFAMLHAKQIFTTYAPQDPGLQLKQLCYDSKKSPQKIFKYKNYYIYNGRLMSFYNTKLKNIDGEMKPTEHLTNLWTDISWGGITKEGGVMMNKAKKPEKLIQRIIELSTNKNDIILDFFLGYGTTAAVAHKMDRRWIGIEQMDYMETSTKKRISNVIFGDKTGISKAVDWQGGGSFVYLELKKYNQRIIDLIWAATNKEQIKEIYKEIQQNAFVNFWFDHKAFEKEEEWSKLPLEEQKGLLIDIIDQNQLYLNLLDMDDTSHEVSEIEKVLTRRFYGEK